MTSAMTQQQVQYLEYGVRTRQALVTYLRLMALFGGWMIVLPELWPPRPLDYAGLAFPVGALLVTYLLIAPLGVWWTSRQKVTLRPDGIVTHIGLIAWPWVRGVSPTWPAFGRSIVLVLADGRKLLLRAPLDTRLRAASPDFKAQLAEIREYALRHGARVDAPAPQRRWAAATLGTMAMVVLGGLIYLPLTRPIVTPWTPTAVSIPDACVALETAGLDKHWPAATRELDSKDARSDSSYDEAECSWDWTDSDESDVVSPYGGVTAVIKKHHAKSGSSGVAEAMDDVALEREVSGADQVWELPLAGADEAVETVDVEFAERTVLARRGDVTVELVIELSGEAPNAAEQRQARRVAADLASSVLKQVRFE